jgi:hypothetical protein
MPEHSGATPPLLKEWVMKLHLFCNMLEQISGHLEPMAKILLVKHRVLNRIVAYKLVIQIDL